MSLNRSPFGGRHEARSTLSTDGRFGRLRRTGNRPSVGNAVPLIAPTPMPLGSCVNRLTSLTESTDGANMIPSIGPRPALPRAAFGRKRAFELPIFPMLISTVAYITMPTRSVHGCAKKSTARSNTFGAGQPLPTRMAKLQTDIDAAVVRRGNPHIATPSAARMRRNPGHHAATDDRSRCNALPTRHQSFRER